MSREYPAWKYGKVVTFKSLVVSFLQWKNLQEALWWLEYSHWKSPSEFLTWFVFSLGTKVGPQPVLNGVRPPISRVITPFITSRGPPCRDPFKGACWACEPPWYIKPAWISGSADGYQQEIIINIYIYRYIWHFFALRETGFLSST